MFDIRFTECAIEDLRGFARSEQKRILAALETELSIDAARESDDRKRLHYRGSPEWEIRLGDVRVFYDVDLKNDTVKIEAVGKKLLI